MSASELGVVAPPGFRAAGVSAGIKPSGELDLALVAADRPCVAASVFTTNQAVAAPVLVSRRHLEDPAARAVVINSGNANAATGEAGLAAATATTVAAARLLDCNPDEVLVCSTGPIGPQLPVDRLIAALPAAFRALDRSPQAAAQAAVAIMTTDTVPKRTAVEAEGYVIGGMGKGAGMVRPGLATMLAVLTTDADVDARTAREALVEAVDPTFNALNIDGAQSTNDTVILLASGTGRRPERDRFVEDLRHACRLLASQMAADAEGASRVVTIDVSGASDDSTARSIGMAISDSALLRASFYGGDPNWGRVLGAAGAGPARLDQAMVDIDYAGVPVARSGMGVPYDVGALHAALQGDFTLSVCVGDGPGTATVLTTDLTPEYVHFNAEPS